MGKLINGTFIPQWQLDGKRRPLPPLYEAVQKYGEQNVYFDKPKYVENGHCLYCGKKITNKRRKSYCSDKCSITFQNSTVWHRGRGAYGTNILYRDNFTCQDCGEFHALQNEYGVYLPVSDGQLDIHHILPVSQGGGDEPSNLITLCRECHKKRHEK